MHRVDRQTDTPSSIPTILSRILLSQNIKAFNVNNEYIFFPAVISNPSFQSMFQANQEERAILPATNEVDPRDPTETILVEPNLSCVTF